VLDFSATVTVLTGKHRGYIYELDDSLSGSAVATVARGGVLLINGGGRAGVFDGLLYSETLRNTVVSLSQVTRHGFEVTFSGYTAEVIHPDGHRIPCVKQPGPDIWWVPLDQIFEATSWLPRLRGDVDELELLHRRTGHISHNTLREAVRNILVRGVVLPFWQ
jgi:hypothetical protein